MLKDKTCCVSSNRVERELRIFSTAMLNWKFPSDQWKLILVSERRLQNGIFHLLNEKVKVGSHEKP